MLPGWNEDPPAISEQQSVALLEACGTLRQEACEHNSQLHLEKISVASLDKSIVSCGFSRPVLNHHGYNIGVKQYRNAKSPDEIDAAASSSRVGHKTKVDDPECIKFVGGILGKYVKDSSKVVSIRQHGEKTLVCAKLLSKTLGHLEGGA